MNANFPPFFFSLSSIYHRNQFVCLSLLFFLNDSKVKGKKKEKKSKNFDYNYILIISTKQKLKIERKKIGGKKSF